MDYTQTDAKLTITVDSDDQKRLQELRNENPDSFGSDSLMHDEFENLIANSELDWLSAEDTGDLTSAPILGILGNPEPGAGGVLAGNWPDSSGTYQTWYHPIIQRWAFMDYQIKSVLDDLADHGKAVFIS